MLDPVDVRHDSDPLPARPILDADFEILPNSAGFDTSEIRSDLVVKSLASAALVVGEDRYNGAQIRELYDGQDIHLAGNLFSRASENGDHLTGSSMGSQPVYRVGSFSRRRKCSAC